MWCSSWYFKKLKHDGLRELDRIATTRKDASKYNDSSSEQLKTLLKKIKMLSSVWNESIRYERCTIKYLYKVNLSNQ